MRKQNLLFILVFLGMGFLTNCNQSEETPQLESQTEVPTVVVPTELLKALSEKSPTTTIEVMDVMNETMFKDKPYRLSEIFVYTEAQPATQVTTIDQQFESTLDQRWVPGDTRRNWNGDGDLNDIDYLSFSLFSTSSGVNGPILAEPVYQDMLNIWETEGPCKNVEIDFATHDFFTQGNPSNILIIGGQLPPAQPFADVTVTGFLPAFIFDIVFGSPNVLGVAFAFTFVDENGNVIRSRRGKADKSFNEVWFNDGFSWTLGANPGSIDIESVVLHEFGHTLNLGHFGILQSFETEDSFDLRYVPVNTMNALYIGELRNFLGQNDKGNFCESWGSWPFN